MRFAIPVLLAAAALVGPAAAAQTYSQDDIDSGEALFDMSKTAYENAMGRVARGESGAGCTPENVRVRKEWRKMPGPERIAYREAVECLMQTDSQYTDVDGARSGFDDFGVLHYKLTPYVHNSATFLLFHRYYLYTYEAKLRECGYTDTIPYWEWGLDCDSVDDSPVFDGSETSMGRNGVYDAGAPNPGAPLGAKAGTGGGCVPSGPFSDYTVNLGPLTAEDPLAYNPRCLKRNLNSDICSRWATLRNTTDTITAAGGSIALFQALVQGDYRWSETAGLDWATHGGGHYSIGGDPGGDFYFSPLEPGFYLHHGQIDRMYFVWQNLDWENRQEIFGTGTMFNIPPSRDVLLSDTLDFAPINDARTVGELIDTLGNEPFCYVYE